MDGCGYSCWRPVWLQKFAKTRWYIVVYALLGTIQSASTTYFAITLTTIEKRFRIPSQTTGIVLSGNEISQILLSLILTYFGGQKNCPKWMSWGIVSSALSCFILAWPHFIYGAGEEALQYTQEYLSLNQNITTEIISTPTKLRDSKLCQNSFSADIGDADCDEEFSYVPLFLIFLSQFILGIGNTLYYSLGPTYIDDNSKLHKTPLMLSISYALRIFGPALGYAFAYIMLKIYIAPTLTPVIAKDDPRWMGAWWLGWLIAGSLIFVFALLIGLFPRKIRNDQNPVEQYEFDSEKTDQKNEKQRKKFDEMKENGALKDFPRAIWRLLTNKLLLLNCFNAVFYILCFSGTMTFIGRVMEVQFNKTSAGGSIFTGPLTMAGMALGMLLSGFLITKYKPSPNRLFMWNVVSGLILVCSTFFYTQLGCENSNALAVNGTIVSCNSNCICDGISYNPVCDRSTTTTYFSPCHAGCKSFDEALNIYTDCTCTDESLNKIQVERFVSPGACLSECNFDYYAYSFISMISSFISVSGFMSNILINFRSVEPRDKALGQGFSLFTASLFALIPGPIIFGRIIDSTCLVWNNKCNRKGNCLLYDPVKFRYYIHSSAGVCLLIGVFFDFLIWCYGKNMDLYGDASNEKTKQIENEADDSPECQPLKV